MNPGDKICKPFDPHKKKILNPSAELGITKGISINRSMNPFSFLFFILDIKKAMGVANRTLITVSISAISIDVIKACVISVIF